jgi:hypothetical protein
MQTHFGSSLSRLGLFGCNSWGYIIISSSEEWNLVLIFGPPNKRTSLTSITPFSLASPEKYLQVFFLVFSISLSLPSFKEKINK